MLLAIREKTQSWLAWLIVGLISIPFALFGIQSYITTDTNIAVASVDGNEISFNDYQNALKNYKYRIKNILGDRYDPALLETESVKKGVLNEMIKQELVANYLKDSGFNVADKRVISAIKAVPAFKLGKKFNHDIYIKSLAAQGLSESDFEERVRLDIIRQQFRQTFNNFSFSTDKFINNTIRLQTQKRSVSLLKIPLSKIKINNKVTKAQIEQFYKKNKNIYANPEALKVNFVELSTDELRKKITVTDQELKTAYQQNKATLLTTETRDVSHIMIIARQKDIGASEKRKINKIYQQLKKGVNFEKLAKEKSEDPGSADKGGRLGYKSKDDMDDKLTDALFKMKKGEISKPIRSKFGFHILKLNNIKAPKIKSFKASKKQLILEIKQQKAQEAFANIIEDFSNLAYEKSDSLDALADEFSLKIQNSGWITRSGAENNKKESKIFKNPKVIKAIFDNNVILDKQNSDIVELSDEHFAVFRMTEHRPKGYFSLDKVSDNIQKSIITKRRLNALNKKGADIITQLQKAGNANKIAKSLGLRWGKFNTYMLTSKLDEAIKSAMFSMAKPKKKQYSYQGVPGKKYTIIRLKSVTFEKSDKINKMSEKLQLQIKLDSALADYTYANFIKQLKADADVSIFYNQILDDKN